MSLETKKTEGNSVFKTVGLKNEKNNRNTSEPTVSF